MVQRDLTYSGPVDAQDEYGSHNPFVNPGDGESESLSSSNRRSSSQLDSYPEVMGEPGSPGDNYGRAFNGYSGNGTTSRLLSNEYLPEEGGTGSSSGKAAEAAIQLPPEYDRYPSMMGSRVVSSTSLSSNMYNQSNENSPQQKDMKPTEEESSISKGGNPFMYATDFSPFGGYPALSFPLYIEDKEPDDYMHNPDPIADAQYDKNRFYYDMKNMDRRAFGGIFSFLFLLAAAGAVFVVLPALTYTGVTSGGKPQVYEVLTDYAYPIVSSVRSTLIDRDTPEDAYTKKSLKGETWNLVFSDEFNAEGRTFYDGDDQFFTAVDIHYAGTQDLEWYTPDAVTTANGTLNLKLDAFKNHDLFYRSGMVQSWNKLCFSEGILEYSARLPYYGKFEGLWPGMWAMGNLGRPGYMASTNGMWPYSYNECDAGITKNQSSPDGISQLPGQRLPLCVCDGEDHPSPGTGRGAPEIDAIEARGASSGSDMGTASQSWQVGPMDIWYYPDYNFVEIYNSSVTVMNTYTGGPLQQAVSGTTTLNNDWYEKKGLGQYINIGFEYLNGRDDGYLMWFIGDQPSLTVYSYALSPNGNVGWRDMPKEPMALVMNLGLSNSWDAISWPDLEFPVTMSFDYIRIYQPPNKKNIGCDPDGYPTTSYILEHPKAYQDMNLTTWDDTGYGWPKNSLVDKCKSSHSSSHSSSSS